MPVRPLARRAASPLSPLSPARSAPRSLASLRRITGTFTLPTHVKVRGDDGPKGLGVPMRDFDKATRLCAREGFAPVRGSGRGVDPLAPRAASDTREGTAR